MFLDQGSDVETRKLESNIEIGGHKKSVKNYKKR